MVVKSCCPGCPSLPHFHIASINYWTCSLRIYSWQKYCSLVVSNNLSEIFIRKVTYYALIELLTNFIINLIFYHNVIFLSESKGSKIVYVVNLYDHRRPWTIRWFIIRTPDIWTVIVRDMLSDLYTYLWCSTRCPFFVCILFSMYCVFFIS
jgi:hypothetical protein